MGGLGSALEITLLFSGGLIGIFVLWLQNSQSRRTALAYPLLFLGVFLLAIGTDRIGFPVLSSESHVYALFGANALFLAALWSQLRAVEFDDGPPHPDGASFETGSQTYPWEED